MHIGIRTKFILLISTLLLIIFGSITLYQIRNNTQTLRTSLFEQSRAFATLATQPIGNVFGIYKDSGTYKIDQQIDNFLALNDSITDVSIVNVSGDIVFSKNKELATSVTKEQASTFEPIYINNEAGNLSTIVFPYFEASGAHRFSLVYSVSDDEIDMAVRNEARSLLIFGLTSLIVTMISVYLLINKFIIGPIKRVSEQAEIISSGNLEQQIITSGRDEIATLGLSVNKMAESLKASILQLKEIDKVKSEFMMITSHNLRTPLTIIKGYLDNMELVKDDPDKLSSSLNRIGLSVKRLELFAEDVLTVSRLELGDSDLQLDSLKLSEFINRICEEFVPVAELKSLKFITDIQDGETPILISTAYMRSAIWNLLDNASKFTSEDGEIRLSTIKKDNSILISISDTGIGIIKSEIPKLFTKFHRGTSTLTYDFEGTGIGLYAAKAMVAKHGGTITVETEEGKGSKFTIHLPIKSPIGFA